MSDLIAVPLPLFDRLVHVVRQLSEGDLDLTEPPAPSAFLVPTADLLELRSIIDEVLFARRNAPER